MLWDKSKKLRLDFKLEKTDEDEDFITVFVGELYCIMVFVEPEADGGIFYLAEVTNVAGVMLYKTVHPYEYSLDAYIEALNFVVQNLKIKHGIINFEYNDFEIVQA